MLCFIPMSTSLLFRKFVMRPSMDLALLIRVWISASLFSSVVIVEPRYWKLWVN